VAFVDVVANSLADEVIGNGEAGQAMIREQLPFFGDVLFRRRCGVHIEMVAPAGEFDAVVAHFFGEGCELSEREIGPLAGEECNVSWHGGGWEKCAAGICDRRTLCFAVRARCRKGKFSFASRVGENGIRLNAVRANRAQVQREGAAKRR
jgi:hypothetical protein